MHVPVVFFNLGISYIFPFKAHDSAVHTKEINTGLILSGHNYKERKEEG